MSVTIDNNNYIFNCPHCEELIIVSHKQLNCCIFRHGVYKHNLKQINPHTTKNICEMLVKNNKIFGCGKPFKFIKATDTTPNKIEICDYI
ncbi:hypothetical protein crov077 [Cafeteria roenbergensis virus]|uniref:Uncharacterized protein n=1 Tax=Cafeteria roenbergensis virus (strain BV-PW1) TaxID=693272 RepID=E3T4J7_CROVB|nr:hypothetical protein crov077 [Cafeteria roenbergensis virus BV-PW1]ADO67110.1 hypothetical protein crov077 [Cafeteria roenbergensis virus BV-PW1]